MLPAKKPVVNKKNAYSPFDKSGPVRAWEHCPGDPLYSTMGKVVNLKVGPNDVSRKNVLTSSWKGTKSANSGVSTIDVPRGYTAEIKTSAGKTLSLAPGRHSMCEKSLNDTVVSVKVTRVLTTPKPAPKPAPRPAPKTAPKTAPKPVPNAGHKNKPVAHKTVNKTSSKPKTEEDDDIDVSNFIVSGAGSTETATEDPEPSNDTQVEEPSTDPTIDESKSIVDIMKDNMVLVGLGCCVGSVLVLGAFYMSTQDQTQNQDQY